MCSASKSELSEFTEHRMYRCNLVRDSKMQHKNTSRYEFT